MCLTALVAVSMKVTEFDADRDDRERLVVGRKAHAVHQHLPLVERAEIAGLGIAEPDHAEQLVVDGIGDRDRVGKLFGGVDAVAMADRNVRGGRGAGAWPAKAAAGDIRRALESRRSCRPAGCFSRSNSSSVGSYLSSSPADMLM